jgi:hypothetical protein
VNKPLGNWCPKAGREKKHHREEEIFLRRKRYRYIS